MAKGSVDKDGKASEKGENDENVSVLYSVMPDRVKRKLVTMWLDEMSRLTGKTTWDFRYGSYEQMPEREREELIGMLYNITGGISPYNAASSKDKNRQRRTVSEETVRIRPARTVEELESRLKKTRRNTRISLKKIETEATAEVLGFMSYLLEYGTRKEWEAARPYLEQIKESRGGYSNKSMTIGRIAMEAKEKTGLAAGVLPETLLFLYSKFADTRDYTSLEDLLLEAGVPDDAFLGNKALWELVRSAHKPETASYHQVFHVQDSYGNRRIFKLYTDEGKARAWNLAHKCLAASQFGFIAPEEVPEVIKAGQYFIAIQEELPIIDTAPKSIEYWLASIATLHTAGTKAIDECRISLPEYELEITEFLEQAHDRSKRVNGVKLDMNKLREAIAILKESGERTLIHGDIKNDNIRGEYREKLIDLDVTTGDPAIDIAGVLMLYNIPEEQWKRYIGTYLDCRSTPKETRAEKIEDLYKRVEAAKYLVAAREIMGYHERHKITDPQHREARIISLTEYHNRDRQRTGTRIIRPSQEETAKYKAA